MSFAANIFAWFFVWVFGVFFQANRAVLHTGSQICPSKTTIQTESVTRADPHLHPLQFPTQICTTPQANGSLGAQTAIRGHASSADARTASKGDGASGSGMCSSSSPCREEAQRVVLFSELERTDW